MLPAFIDYKLINKSDGKMESWKNVVFKVEPLLRSVWVGDLKSINSKSAEEIRLLTSCCIYYPFLVKWNIGLTIMSIIQICMAIALCSASC